MDLQISDNLNTVIMVSELNYLYFFLFLAFVLGPVLSNCLFFNNSKMYSRAHIISLITVSIAFFLNANKLLAIWILFCTFGLLLQIKKELKNGFSIKTSSTFIPFIFSIIASIWFVAGANDLFLLGYDKNWSFYAALHGNYLGWIFLGCLAALSKKDDSKSTLYASGCYLCLVLFLMIAFGIDGVPYIKPIGVIGISLLVPFFMILHIMTSTNKCSKILTSLSVLCVMYTLVLALLNEFWTMRPHFFLGARSMVSLHGLINALVVLPLFYFAVKIDCEEIK